MGAFDLRTFLELQGQGAGTFTSIGTAFGMPSCLLNLGNDILGILPSSILRSIDKVSNEARLKANEIVAASLKRLFLNTGIIEYDTESGLIKFGSLASLFGLESDDGSDSSDLGAFLGAAAGAVAAGAQLYRNYQNISSQIEAAIDCITGYQKSLDYQGALAADKKRDLADLDPAAYQAMLDAEYARYKEELQKARNFISEVDRLRADLERILLDRLRNPEKEPEFTSQWRDIVGDRFKVESEDEEDPNEIIRLIFGPPKSINGQFLLSIDGLYYDSQTSGIDPVLTYIEGRKAKLKPEDKWKYDYDPNIGGRGLEVTKDTFTQILDALFYINNIDESKEMQKYYNSDHFLKVIKGQKQKRVDDISNQISELEAAAETEAIIDNFKQVLMSEIARFDDKIKRRKKQIEIAVKAPSLFGAKTEFSPGHIPINDFSYLEDIKLPISLDKQKKLVFKADEVSGVVLPVKTKFVRSVKGDSDIGLNYLYVPEFGIGEIITDYGVSSTSSVPTASISDVVVTEGLFAIYNYLESDISQPSSIDNFGIINCISKNNYNNAALIGQNTSSIFTNGLAIPYLRGITLNSGVNPSALGSFIKLPDTREFRNFTYNKEGFTFETWVRVPNLATSSGWVTNSVSSLHRIILACENTGINDDGSPQDDLQALRLDNGTMYTKGLLLGFTRDRRITKDLPPSNSILDNDARNEDGYALYLAPTQSNSASTVGFIGNFDDNNCMRQDGWKALKVFPTNKTESGYSISSISNEFCLLTLTVDHVKDKITVYLDGEVITSSTVTSVFGSSQVKLPTLIKNNSFEYDTTSVGNLAPESLKYGPKLNTYFTPWILGGGYTDGMALYGNFMGSNYGGVISGLNGYLGSTKFYSRPLTSDEVEFNYSRQSLLFKNIDI